MKQSLVPHFVSLRQGARLPHWTMPGAIYSVCFRLADSLPARLVAAWQIERKAFLATFQDPVPPDQIDRVNQLFSHRIDQLLNAGHGACWLRQPPVAKIVAEALRYFDRERYALHAWCIMPNHVHAVLQPIQDHSLPAIMKSWKGFSGREANRFLNRTGPFWQVEYHDHLVRDDADYIHALHYVMDNPMQARLVNWPWTWASPDAAARAVGLATSKFTGRAIRATPPARSHCPPTA